MENSLFNRSILDLNQGEHSGVVEIGAGDNPKNLLRITAGDSANPPGIILHWDAAPIGQIPAAPDHLVHLELSWGISKAEFSATVDCKKGGRLFLAATTLNVNVRFSGTSNPRYRVAAAAVYGDADTPRPTSTTLIPNLAAAASTTLVTPKYADSIVVHPSNIAATLAQVRFLHGEAGASVIGAVVIDSALLVPVALPIPNGCEFINITNPNVVATGYSVVFGLAL